MGGLLIEVRDCPRKGYLVPGRDGLGVWPDGRVVDASSPSPLSASFGNLENRKFHIKIRFCLIFDYNKI